MKLHEPFPIPPEELANIATTLRKQKEDIVRLVNALQGFLDYAEEPPKANCSCHISPPCNDCVDHSMLREVFADARAALGALS